MSLFSPKDGHDNNLDVRAAVTPYLAPFDRLLRDLAVPPGPLPSSVNLSREQFILLIQSFLKGVQFDEGWYRATYPDVDEAIKAGEMQSAQQHFIENGYFEGRKAGPVFVDDAWYMKTYPDVAEGVKFGDISSCHDHFLSHGEDEGRFPSEFAAIGR